MRRLSFILLTGMVGAFCALAQAPSTYTPTNVTGQLVLTRTVNLMQQGAQLRSLGAAVFTGTEVERAIPLLGLPPATRGLSMLGGAAMPNMKSLPVSSSSSTVGFLGLTHADQRNANNGNQLSVEPPSPALAVGNGFVLEGVNNAVQVYSATGTPLLPQALSSNQVFGLAPALDRSTGTFGVFPTDMRVFYDQTINRWFVIQRAQDEDIAGNPLLTSHLYIAVSQTGDPTGTYNVYVMDTTNSSNPGCPCVPDFPQIGADQYGFYISANEFSTTFQQFEDSSILAISKAALGAGAATPTTSRFIIRVSTGYEFAIQPASTPAGASYVLANGGVEYLVSTKAELLPDSNVAVWALSNTSSLGTANPSLLLTQSIVPALQYGLPGVATQRPGPLPYGSSLTPPGMLSFVDGGDTRVLSACYSDGRLYATFATNVTDESGHSLVGGAYSRNAT